MSKKAFKWILIGIISVVALLVMHKFATVTRGYEAMGGEMFALLIPFFVWYVQDCKKQLKEDKNEKQKNRR